MFANIQNLELKYVSFYFYRSFSCVFLVGFAFWMKPWKFLENRRFFFLIQQIMRYLSIKIQSNLRCQSWYLFIRVQFLNARQKFRELSRNFSQIWIQNGGNWRWRFLWNPNSLGVMIYIKILVILSTFQLLWSHFCSF